MEISMKSSKTKNLASKKNIILLPQQQQQGLIPSSEELKGKWKQQVGDAKILWGKITEDELLKVEGHQQKLAGLIQERYAVTQEEASKQVSQFFDKH